MSTVVCRNALHSHSDLTTGVFRDEFHFTDETMQLGEMKLK